jgi:hypothetical protein
MGNIAIDRIFTSGGEIFRNLIRKELPESPPPPPYSIPAQEVENRKVLRTY